MIYLQVLCEGVSDVPVIREVLTRRFGLVEGDHFCVHPHSGKGKLPSKAHRLKPPSPTDRSLLGQLPVKLKNYGGQSGDSYETAVVVIVDADNDDCRKLKRQLLEVYEELPSKPRLCLFRIAVEETESWFIADAKAVKRAYPKAKIDQLKRHDPDAICGAWEQLARALSRNPTDCPRGDKTAWATDIAPHLDLSNPKSPSLSVLIQGLARLLS